MLSAMDFFWERIVPNLDKGLWLSVQIIVPSAVIGFFLGVLIGTLRVFGSPKVRKVMDLYTSVIRGVPLVVQLFILYFGLPSIGIYFQPYTAAVLGFILCSGAYHSEYVRGALLSIKQGQLKAAYALGFTKLQTVLWIVVPQAVRRALPGCGNEIIYLIKYSSLAYIVTCMELTGKAKALAAQTFRFTEVFFAVGLYYLFLTTVATWVLAWIERKIHIPGFGGKSH